MPGEIDEIKARVDIIDLVSEYIRLKPAGTNNWRALCPFHNEKTPSFMVSRDKQIWHCFGCGEGGDIFSFVQKIENLEFPEALRLLAQKAGVTLKAVDPQLTSQKNRLFDICQLAANFWHKVLTESPAGKNALVYLKNRGLTEQTISDFKIGYAPESWDTLVKFLKSRDFKDQEIFLAGLSVKKERGTDFYDRFRDRIMFPINDAHGNPIGFSGRLLTEKPEAGGKYINTPQTLIYNKSLVLFNLDKAKPEIKNKDLAIIVEGQMDVVSVWQAKTLNVIATSGTALTPDHLKILKRYTKNLAFCFDMDLAGESAARRGIDLALGEDLDIKIIVLPVGKDPDECVRHHPAEWLAAVTGAKSIMEYYFEKTFSRFDPKTVDGKKKSAAILLPLINRLGSKIEQTHWLSQLAEKIKVSEAILRETIPKIQRQKIDERKTAALVPSTDRDLMLGQRILAIALKYPLTISFLIDNLPPEIIINEALNQLYKQLIIYYTEDIKSTISDFNYQNFHLKLKLKQLKPQNLESLADRLVLAAEKDFFDFDFETVEDELFIAINFAKKNFYSAKLKRLEDQIKIAEKQGDANEVKNLLNQFNEVAAQLKLLE